MVDCVGLLGVSRQNSLPPPSGGAVGRGGDGRGGDGVCMEWEARRDMNERTKLYTLVRIRGVEFGNRTFQPKIFRLKTVKIQIVVLG